MKRLIIHHDDLDGRLSAAIASRFYRKDHSFLQLGYSGRNIEADLKLIKTFDKFVMLDFSYAEEDMIRLFETGKFELWIDHHHSSFQIFKSIKDTHGTNCVVCPGPTPAACEITWRHFFPDEELPQILRLASRWDTWKFPETNDPNPVLLMAQEDYESSIRLPEDHINWLISSLDGRFSINQTPGHVRITQARRALGKQKTITYKGVEFFAINSEDVTVLTATNALWPQLTGKPMLIYTTDLNNIKASFRSNGTDFDCTTVARGHKEAAGAVIPLKDFIQ